MIEQWRDILGQPGYQASTLGRIRSVDRTVIERRSDGSIRFRHLRGRVLAAKQRRARRGHLAYRDVALSHDGKPHSETVHRLVCLAFHGAPPSPAHEVAHRDSDPSNNRPDNVRWASVQENKNDYRHNGKSARDVSSRARDEIGQFA